MPSIRRRLTAKTVNELVSSERVNSLVDAATVNSLVDAATVNSLVDAATVNSLVSSKVRAGVKWVNNNSESTVDLGSTVVGAVVAFNDLGNIETGCGVTWSGSVITIRNSSGDNLSISYVAVVS